MAVDSADEFYSIMGVLTREMLEFGLMDTNNLIKVCFRHDQPWGPPYLLYNGYRVFPRGESGQSVSLTIHPPSSTEVKETVQIYLYSPLAFHGLF